MNLHAGMMRILARTRRGYLGQVGRSGADDLYLVTGGGKKISQLINMQAAASGMIRGIEGSNQAKFQVGALQIACFKMAIVI